MLRKAIIITILLLAHVYAGNAQSYDKKSATSKARSHRVIAIDQPLIQMRMRSRVKPEQLEQIELENAQDVHQIMIDQLSDRLEDYGIKVLSYDETFDRLETHDGYEGDDLSYEEMIQILDVDAILVSDYQLDESSSNFGILGGGIVSIGLGAPINRFGRNNESTLAFYELFDAESSLFIWNKEIRHSHNSNRLSSIIKGMMKRLTKDLPYEKRKKRRR